MTTHGAYFAPSETCSGTATPTACLREMRRRAAPQMNWKRQGMPRPEFADSPVPPGPRRDLPQPALQNRAADAALRSGTMSASEDACFLYY